MTNFQQYPQGTIETRGLFQDPIINGYGSGSNVVDPTTILGNGTPGASYDFGFFSHIWSFFDLLFYFIYTLIKIPLLIFGWIFGIDFGLGVGAGLPEFLASLTSGSGLLGYLGYFLPQSWLPDGFVPGYGFVSDSVAGGIDAVRKMMTSGSEALFGKGIGEVGGYQLIPDGTWNPFVIIKNFFVNPYGGPSFAEMYFGDGMIWWWLLAGLLIWFLMFWRKKIKELDKKAAEIYDNPEEYEEDELFHDVKKKERWNYILKLLNEKDDPEDWKEAVLLADDLLTEVFEDNNLTGNLKQIFSKVDMESVSSAIKARTFAKSIRDGELKDLNRTQTKIILDDYSRVFKELYYM